jgi:hypothetical protein
MKLTDKHRSLIATAFVAAFDYAIAPAECKRRSLCCSKPVASYNVCLQIVGGRSHRAAIHLRNFFYEELGCGGWRDRDYQDVQEQYFLDKISALETL